jgi:asparagine synthase (glutamine-hydrolysing)
MCGIAAILGEIPAGRVELSLRAMLDAQVHRGPDDDGWVVVSAGQSVLGLGNRRLAIQDVSPLGHQPMRNEDTGDLLVYNGEIYNAPQLKASLTSEGYRFRSHSDTEILLRAYEHWGIECLDRLRGMFAFAVWDARRSRLVIARDHLGIKPLYYSCNDHCFACASEVRALVQSGLVSSAIDRRALAGYLAYGGVQEPLTICENVFSLPRGSWKELDPSGKVMAEGKYWQFPPVQQSIRERSLPDLVEEGRALLQQSLCRHLLSDVRLGIFLSSGLDSTAILALSEDQNRLQPLDAFTVSFPDRPQYDERALARATAARFSACFHDCPVSDSTALRWIGDALECMDQPSMDGFNTYIVARAIRQQGIVVALSGLGGDEVFGGYNLFRRVPRTYDMMSWLNLLPRSMRVTAAQLATVLASRVARHKAKEIATVDPGLIGMYFHYRRLVSDFGLGMFGLDAESLGLSEDFQIRELRYEDCYVPADHVVSVGRLDTAFYLQNILLRDSDVFGMANSLEIRVPFLDRDLVEWAFRLPGDVLLPRRAPLKYLLRKICADLYTKSQLHQPKRGFVLPFGAWLVGPLREMMEENLRFLRGFGLLDPAGIEVVRRLFQDEPAGPAWSRVWALVTLGQWLKTQTASSPVAAHAGQPA